MKHPQPAKYSYFFHGGFVELNRVIIGAFEQCGDIIVRSKDGLVDTFDNIKDGFSDGFFTGLLKFIPNLFMLGFYFFRLILCSVITPAICIFIAIFQITILLAFFLTAIWFFLVIILIDWLYCSINSIANHCPRCQKHFYMPEYICPCGNKHDRLRPGIYGILKRKCRCGNKLPTTFLNGRQKLNAQCPFCGNNVKDGGLQASWCIPVVGGPSSGKTCYINMTMMSLEKNARSKYNMNFVYENNGLDEYQENSDRLSKGYVPEKTTDHRLRYYQFSLTPKGATKQLISLCDVAGELFDINSGGGGDTINTQIGFRFANSFILIVDPLAIPDYRDEVAKATQLNGYKGSAQRLDEMVETFVRTLQNMFSIKANAMLKTDVAVVFTKTDIPGLDQKIGEGAVLKKAPSLDQKTKYRIKNELCEKFLRDYNEENFLRNLKSRFRSIQFFTCSALGHVENGTQFAPANVEEPFFWLVTKTSKVIKNTVK